MVDGSTGIGVVENLAYTGLGVLRHEGKVVFLPFTAPGDHVTFELAKEFPRHALGRVREIIQEGRGRTSPECSVFGRCGGCHLQHLQYEAQLHWKEVWLRDALERIGGIKAADVVRPIIPSPEVMRYRNKATVHVRHGAIGFLARGTDEVVDVESCPVLLPVLQNALQAVRPWISSRTQEGDSFRIVLRAGDKRDGVAVFHTRPSRFGQLTELAKTLPGFRCGYGKVPHTVTYSLGTIDFHVSAGAFFQVNSSLLLTMTELVQRFVGHGHYLVDGHAGVGWPSLCLAGQFERISAVEISRSAKSLGERNAGAAASSTVSFFGGTLYSARRGGVLDANPDVVLLDPPRSGLRVQDLESVVQLKPERIVYISCDPPTLARDVRRLGSHGFFLEGAQPIDLFPETYHMETIVALRR
jgi:23S rRNA (uracil1939-C5)-methyltransferase